MRLEVKKELSLKSPLFWRKIKKSYLNNLKQIFCFLLEDATAIIKILQF